MPTFSLDAGAITATWALTEGYGTSPADSYAAWASALGVSDTETLENLTAGGPAPAITLAAPLFSGGSTTAFLSTDGALGFYEAAPANTTFISYGEISSPNMDGFTSRPRLLLRWHNNWAVRLASAKIQRSGTTTILYAVFDDPTYFDYIARVALRITPDNIDAVSHAVDIWRRWKWSEYTEGETAGTVTPLAGADLHEQASGTTIRLTFAMSYAAVAPEGIIAAPGPLGAPAILSGGAFRGMVAAAGPLGVAAVLGASTWGLTAAPGPLGAVRITARARPAGLMSAPGPLGAPQVLAEHDFTDVLEAAGAVEFYVCDLVDGAAVLRVPVSSWQGTQQIDGACYLQAVVPAVADIAATIGGLGSAAEFVISRGARLPDGTAVENEMARSAIEQVQFDQGPQRYTCTLSGYSAAIEAPTGEGVGPRQLRGVRSISSGTGGTRTRCAIDWYLRPGQYALAGAVPLMASYINYYVQGRDAYMDVGERA